MSLIGFQSGMMSAGSSGDPFYANVSLLLHCDGANGGTTFLDNSQSPKTPAVVGAAQTSTSQKKFGTSSLHIPGTGDRLVYSESAGFGFGDGDWTVEAWVRLENTDSRINNVFDTRSSSYTGVGLWVGGGMFGIPSSSIGFSSNTAALQWGGTVPTDGSFTHVAWTRSSGIVRGFINGVLAFTQTDSRTLSSAATFFVGADAFGTTSQVALGYSDEIRVTKGIARYTSSFTPPSAPFPNS